MFKRLLLLVLLIPSLALAEGDQLGPPTTIDSSQGSGRDASQLLQPASPTTSQSLQSADAIEGGVPQAANNNSLQTTGDKAQFDSLAGPTEGGEQHKLSDASSTHPWWIPAIALGAALLFWLEEQFKPFARR